MGMRRFQVNCVGLGYCGHVAEFTFDQFALRYDLVFLDIGKLRFVCTKCGGRKTEVSPIWSDVRHVGDGREPMSE